MLQPSDRQLGEHFDRLLEHRSRLAICVLLSQHERMSFSRFKELLSETDGNLGAQLKKLEESDYLQVKKEFVDRKPTSWYSLTKIGRTALKKHIGALQEIIENLNC